MIVFYPLVKESTQFYMLPGGKYEGQKMTLKRYQGIERRAKCNYFKNGIFGDYEDISMLENEKLF